MFDIIYADPPWRFKNWSMKEKQIKGEKWCKKLGHQYYDCMDDDDIKNIDVGSISNNDCILFLWATYPKLQSALDVINAWGFTYKTVAFTWVKTNKKDHNTFKFGLGYWTRGNPEICLLATKGKPKRINNSITNLSIYPIRSHSSKPNEIRDKIYYLMGDLPRVELFARERCDGWVSLGNEIDGLDINEAIRRIR